MILQLCDSCVLYVYFDTPVCCSYQSYSVHSDVVNHYWVKGYVKGCGCYMNTITSYFLYPQTSSRYSQIKMLSYLTRWVSRGAFQALKGTGSRPQLVKTPHIGNQTLAAAPLPFTGGSPGVRQARALDQERLLQIDWDDGSCSLYPFTWLRDNCQCPLCTLQSAQARKLLLSDLDVHTGMDQVQLMDNKVSLGKQSLKG